MPVFKHEEKLSPEYVPEKLPYREEEMRLLRSFFSSVLNDDRAFQVRVFIWGAVGTGKTSLAKLFGLNLEREARELGRKVRFTYVNSRINRSLYTVLRKTVEQLGLDLPRRGYSDEEVFDVLVKFLRTTGLRLVLCLDEVEALISEEGSEAVYFLTRLGEGTADGGLISLVLIFREPEILDRLDSQTISGMGGNNIHLQEYDYNQLLDILRYRAEEAFQRNALSDEVLEFIAQAAAERKDARYAIDLLWRSGKYAEAEGSSTVEAEHVRKALASVYPTIRRENLSYLSKDERLVLLASARGLSGTRTSITAADLFQYYRLVCEELKTEAKGYTTFWETLQQLQDLGFLRISVKSEGAKGRKTYIYLPGIPVQLLERELLKDISR